YVVWNRVHWDRRSGIKKVRAKNEMVHFLRRMVGVAAFYSLVVGLLIAIGVALWYCPIFVLFMTIVDARHELSTQEFLRRMVGVAIVGSPIAMILMAIVFYKHGFDPFGPRPRSALVVEGFAMVYLLATIVAAVRSRWLFADSWLYICVLLVIAFPFVLFI